MRFLVFALVSTVSALPAAADLKTCKSPDLALTADAAGAAWSREVPAGSCIRIELGNLPGGQKCSYSLEEVLVLPSPLPGVTPPGARAAMIDLGNYQMGRCERIELKVKCEESNAGAKDAIDKTYVVFTGKCGRWVTHYGLGFLPSEDEEHFTRPLTKEDGTAGGFEILAEKDRKDLDTEIIASFSWVPEAERSPWMPRFVGGVGPDLDRRLVFAGVSWVIGENVSLFAAAAGHQQKRLKGKYEVGQILQEDLEASELVEDTFDVNWILGIGFRFGDGKNPFKKEKKKEEEAK